MENNHSSSSSRFTDSESMIQLYFCKKCPQGPTLESKDLEDHREFHRLQKSASMSDPLVHHKQLIQMKTNSELKTNHETIGPKTPLVKVEGDKQRKEHAGAVKNKSNRKYLVTEPNGRKFLKSGPKSEDVGGFSGRITFNVTTSKPKIIPTVVDIPRSVSGNFPSHPVNRMSATAGPRVPVPLKRLRVLLKRMDDQLSPPSQNQSDDNSQEVRTRRAVLRYRKDSPASTRKNSGG